MAKLELNEILAIKKVAKSVKRGDLYRALKYVGDDPIKSCIEDVLRGLLTDKEFKKVVAVFKLLTDDDIYNKYFPEDEGGK
jgi:hypothetical protein